MATSKRRRKAAKAKTAKSRTKTAKAKKTKPKKTQSKKTKSKNAKSAKAKPTKTKPTRRKSTMKKESFYTLPLFDMEVEKTASPPKAPKKPMAADKPLVAETLTVKDEGKPQQKATSNKSVHETAKSMALRQREISVSEFFAKNRHLLGFDSLTKALLTTIKEAVDNSLDACEEAGLLPDILVEIQELAENRYKVIVEDSGPGIVKSQVPKIFGKLLYGSKFHSLKQARGQQGIGISAAGMYAQLTTGKPVTIVTRTGHGHKAQAYEIQIDTKKNMPVIISEADFEWEREHGTRIEMEILATYKKGSRSVDTFVHQVALANPHAHIIYRPPRDQEVVYQRISEIPPTEPLTIKPHPHGVELGVLMDMMKATKSRNLRGFLSSEFSRMGPRISQEVIEQAGLRPSMSAKRVSRDEAEKLIHAFAKAKIMKPPTNCLSVIGEDLLEQSMMREFGAGFYKAITRPPAVYRGNPFQVEVALAYGGKLPDDEIVKLYRFANRAPLIYQQAGCAATSSVLSTTWRKYGVQQSRGALPTGPLVILIHMASVWVPFTSESKESIAHYPEIIKEIKLALQECGRGLVRYIRKGVRERDEEKKRSYIEKYIPHIGIALREILSFSEREEKRVVDELKITLEKSRKL